MVASNDLVATYGWPLKSVRNGWKADIAGAPMFTVATGMATFIPAPPIGHISIQPGAHISPDVGLSDDFTITVSTAEEKVQFCAEPREWLEELRRIVTFRPGARYEYQLLISAAWFRVRTFGSPDGCLYQFTVHDVNLRKARDIMLSAREVVELTQRIEDALAAASA